MKRSLLLPTFLVLLLCGLFFATQRVPFSNSPPPREGVYNVSGNDPAGLAPYKGNATLIRHGSGYVFQGVIDDMHYEGVGLFDPRAGTLSLSFRGQEQGDMGVTLLRVEGDSLRGGWLYMDDPEGGSGVEFWTWQHEVLPPTEPEGD